MHALLLVLHLRLADNAIRLVMRTQHVAGLSVAMAHEGRIVYARGAGYSDLGRGIAASPETVYRIGSLTKPFTDAAVLRLVQQGKLALDDPIARYLAVPWSPTIRIEDLLAQRSGVPSYSDIPSLSPYAAYTPQQLIDAAAAQPLAFAPGTQYQYSNTNAVLLGMLVERVTGISYGRFVATQLTQPLGLAHTQYGDRAGEARGYARDALNMPVRPTSTSYAYAAAGMTSSAPDLVRWLQAERPPYYGFSAANFYGYDVEYANGYVNGYSAFELFDAQTGDRIAILSNADALDLAPLAMDLFASLETPKPGTRAPQQR